MNVAQNVKLLAWHNFFTDLRLYAPVAILYFAKVSGSYALGMSIFSIAMLSQAVLELPTGVFSDLIGRARTVTLGSMAMIVGTIFYALGGTYIFLVVGALLEGLSRAFYSGNNDALLHDSLVELDQADIYAERLGQLSSLFQVAAAIAAVLGSLIANWSFAWVMWLSVIPQSLCFTISLLLTEPTIVKKSVVEPFNHLSQAFKLFIRNPRLRILSLANAMGESAGEAVYQFNATFIASLWPIWAIGIAKALSNVGAAVSFYTAGKMIKQFKEYPLLIWSRVYGRLLSLLAYGLPTFVSPILISSTSLLYGTITVTDNHLKQKEFTHKERATMASLDSLFIAVMMSLMAVLVGLLADWTSPMKALLLMQIFQAVPILFYLKLAKAQA